MTNKQTKGAAEHGAVAQKAASRKRGRYPDEQVPGAKLVPFSVEVGGRWAGVGIMQLLAFQSNVIWGD